jgi:hypothetical protein
LKLGVPVAQAYIEVQQLQNGQQCMLAVAPLLWSATAKVSTWLICAQCSAALYQAVYFSAAHWRLQVQMQLLQLCLVVSCARATVWYAAWCADDCVYDGDDDGAITTAADALKCQWSQHY